MHCYRSCSFFGCKLILVECILRLTINPTVVLGDWPGLLGPTRNGHADSSSTVPDESTISPVQIWKVDAGQGYAGPAVAGNDFVLFERLGENDRVRLLNLTTGKEVWRRDLKAGYRGGIDSDKGPKRLCRSFTSTFASPSSSPHLTSSFSLMSISIGMA